MQDLQSACCRQDTDVDTHLLSYGASDSLAVRSRGAYAGLAAHSIHLQACIPQQSGVGGVALFDYLSLKTPDTFKFRPGFRPGVSTPAPGFDHPSPNCLALVLCVMEIPLHFGSCIFITPFHFTPHFTTYFYYPFPFYYSLYYLFYYLLYLLRIIYI